MARLSELYEIYPVAPGATMPIGLRVDEWLYGSVSALDPLTGRAGGGVRAQLVGALPALKHVLGRGGMTALNIETLKVFTSGEDPDYLAPLRDAFASRLQQGVRKDTLEVDGGPEAEHLGLPFNRWADLQLHEAPAQLAPGQHVRIDFTARLGRHEWAAKMQSQALLGVPEAVKLGPVLWTPALTAADTQGRIPDGIAAQVAGAFDNLERVMEQAEMGRGQVLRIAGFMRDLKDKDLLNEAMVARFPVWSQKPVHKYVPAALPPGIEFALQVIAVEGEERRILEIEGIRHNDPISLGAQVGNVFVSSRVQARLEPSAREQAARLIESHARRLVEHIGGSLDDVSQMVWGIGDPAFEADVKEVCAQQWTPERMPRLDVMQADFPHSPLPRLEFFALLGH